MAPATQKDSNNIPHDLAFNILSKLPVKSLKRFICVHKSWSNLLENPHFLSMYRQNFISKNDDSCFLLKQDVPSSNHQDELFLLSGESFENKTKLDWPPPFHEHNHSVFILGSCVNGTICLFQGNSTGNPTIVLWNPATEEFKVVPVDMRSIEHVFGFEFDAILDVHGFGYDHVTGDFKLIGLVAFYTPPFEFLKDCPEPFWQIYSRKSDCWRKLGIKMTTTGYRFFRGPVGYEVFLNGVCHWWGEEPWKQGAEKEVVLVSFDLSTEVFHTTPVELRDAREFVLRHLVVFSDSIAMITNIVENNRLEISILGEVGVKESWIKLFTIEPLLSVHEPIGVGKKGVIFFRKNDNELAWFDLSTKMIGKIGIKGEAYSCQVVIYKESYLAIGGIHQ